MATLHVSVRAQYDPSESRQAEIDTGELRKAVSMSGDDVLPAATQTIGTTEEALKIGDISTVGYVVVKNLDSTNYVEIGLSGSYTIKVKAGEVQAFRAASSSLYALANTADVRLQVWVFED